MGGITAYSSRFCAIVHVMVGKSIMLYRYTEIARLSASAPRPWLLLPASHGLRIGGDGQSGHCPPRDMGLVGLGAVHTGSLEQAAFDAPIAIPLPETLEDVHEDVLPRGVFMHSDLCRV